MLSPALDVFKYAIERLIQRDKDLWLGSRHRASDANLSSEVESGKLLERFNHWGFQLSHKQTRLIQSFKNPEDLLKTFQLRKVCESSQKGLLGWLEQQYPLILIERIPSPIEMLEIQCEGQRYVTLLRAPDVQNVAIGRHAGALEFTLHDLEHAHKFFGDESLFRGQVRFFRKIHSQLNHPHLCELQQSDAQFAKELEYLLADMNSHPVHMLKYLKAIFLNAHKRRSEFSGPAFERKMNDFFSAWELPQSALQALARLNNPGEECQEDRKLLSDHFSQIQSA